MTIAELNAALAAAIIASDLAADKLAAARKAFDLADRRVTNLTNALSTARANEATP